MSNQPEIAGTKIRPALDMNYYANVARQELEQAGIFNFKGNSVQITSATAGIDEKLALAAAKGQLASLAAYEQNPTAEHTGKAPSVPNAKAAATGKGIA